MYIGTLMYIGMLNLAILLSICHHCVVHTLHTFLQSTQDHLFSPRYQVSVLEFEESSKTWTDPQTRSPKLDLEVWSVGLQGL